MNEGAGSSGLGLLHDFGGSGPTIHLAHGNGFPPGTYRFFSETLRDRYRVIALPQRALWPGTHPDSAPTWRVLVDDLVRGLEALDLSGIVGIGHSMGGTLTLWAAAEHPALFRAVVLIEPVVLTPVRLLGVRLGGRLGLSDRHHLVQGALRRTRDWPNREACFEHFRYKALFARWTDDALSEYVAAGTQAREGGQVSLAFPIEWEAHLFATPPTDIWRAVGRLRTPALIIRGEHSDVLTPSALRRMARAVTHAQFVTIPEAGHLVAMERPNETGAQVRRFLTGLNHTDSKNG